MTQMVVSKEKSTHLVKLPTLDDWAKAKKLRWDKEVSLPYIQKLRILESMEDLPWEIDEGEPTYE